MESTFNAPIILDVGKASRKNIRRLKEGGGKLLEDVQVALQEVKSSLGDGADGKQFVPVILVYRKKNKRRRGGGGALFPLLPFA